MKLLKILLVLSAVMLTGEAVPAQAGGCYGQFVPICGQGKKPVCVCNGDVGQSCSYVCM